MIHWGLSKDRFFWVHLPQLFDASIYDSLYFSIQRPCFAGLDLTSNWKGKSVLGVFFFFEVSFATFFAIFHFRYFIVCVCHVFCWRFLFIRSAFFQNWYCKSFLEYGKLKRTESKLKCVKNKEKKSWANLLTIHTFRRRGQRTLWTNIESMREIRCGENHESKTTTIPSGFLKFTPWIIIWSRGKLGTERSSESAQAARISYFHGRFGYIQFIFFWT